MPACPHRYDLFWDAANPTQAEGRAGLKRTESLPLVSFWPSVLWFTQSWCVSKLLLSNVYPFEWASSSSVFICLWSCNLDVWKHTVYLWVIPETPQDLLQVCLQLALERIHKFQVWEGLVPKGFIFIKPCLFVGMQWLLQHDASICTDPCFSASYSNSVSSTTVSRFSAPQHLPARDPEKVKNVPTMSRIPKSHTPMTSQRNQTLKTLGFSLFSLLSLFLYPPQWVFHFVMCGLCV